MLPKYLTICRKALRMTAASLVFFSPIGAHAQIEPESQLGSRIPVKPKTVDPVRAGVVKKGFARCLYTKNSAKTPVLLEYSDPVTLDLDKLKIPNDDLGKYLGMSTCLGDQADGTQSAIGLRFSPIQLRAMLQEEAYLDAHAEPPALAEGSVEIVQRNYFSEGDNLRAARGLGVFADCLVFKDTRNSDAILRTMPGSKEERAAAQALGPTLGACLVQGQTLSLSPSSIRGFAADGLWTRYVCSPTSTSAEANEKP